MANLSASLPLPASGRAASVLFYTDGLVETRNRDGAFFPLADNAPTLCTGSLDDALDGLLGQLVDHAGDQINDDMAFVLVQQQTMQPF